MSVNPIVQEVQEVKDGVISLPPPTRNLNVPLLSRGDVADFAQAVGGELAESLLWDRFFVIPMVSAMSALHIPVIKQ